MKHAVVAGVLALSILAAARPGPPPQEVAVKSLTPIITVESIEPCLPLWTEALGFEITASVPGEEGLGFAMLRKGAVELMYQTRASIDADLGASGAPATLGEELRNSTTTLFIQVESLDAVIEAVEGRASVIVPRRRTDYGMDEIFVRAPCGTLVGFAMPVGAANQP